MSPKRTDSHFSPPHHSNKWHHLLSLRLTTKNNTKKNQSPKKYIQKPSKTHKNSTWQPFQTFTAQLRGPTLTGLDGALPSFRQFFNCSKCFCSFCTFCDADVRGSFGGTCACGDGSQQLHRTIFLLRRLFCKCLPDILKPDVWRLSKSYFSYPHHGSVAWKRASQDFYKMYVSNKTFNAAECSASFLGWSVHSKLWWFKRVGLVAKEHVMFAPLSHFLLWQLHFNICVLL